VEIERQYFFLNSHDHVIGIYTRHDTGHTRLEYLLPKAINEQNVYYIYCPSSSIYSAILCNISNPTMRTGLRFQVRAI
jgi:hypothetical protein